MTADLTYVASDNAVTRRERRVRFEQRHPCRDAAGPVVEADGGAVLQRGSAGREPGGADEEHVEGVAGRSEFGHADDLSTATFPNLCAVRLGESLPSPFPRTEKNAVSALREASRPVGAGGMRAKSSRCTRR